MAVFPGNGPISPTISAGHSERPETSEKAAPQEQPGCHLPRCVGRRHGRRLRLTQQKRLDDRLPELLIPCRLDGSRSVDPRSDIFSPARPVYMEIGFGAGEHLATLAHRHPDIGFIGVDPYINGVASSLGYLERQALSNVHLFTDDVRHLLPSLKEQSIRRLYVLFPDPWPKRRHNYRRLLAGESLDLLISVLEPGGCLHFATDHTDYAVVVKQSMAAQPNMQLAFDTEDADGRLPDTWIKTRYQEKAERAGKRVFYFQFERINPAKHRVVQAAHD